MLKIIAHLLIFGYFFLIGVDYAVGVTAEAHVEFRNGYTYEKELQAGWEIIVKELQAQIASHPDNAELSYALATVYWHSHPEKVQAQLEQTIRINPAHSKSYFLLGMVHLLNKDFSKFREYMKKAIQADPYYVNAYNTLAMWNSKTKKIDEAIALLEEGKTQMPQEESLYFNQALIFIFKEQYEPAIKNLEKLITLNAGDQEYYYVAGIT
ncbi:MAG: tetratricopeptide repeat protein, partial [Nitrospirales bacterium]